MATVEPSGENQQEDAGPETEALDDMGVSSDQTPRNTVAFTDLQQVPSPATPLEGHATSDIWTVLPEAH
ncbi:hypothetical protein AAWM_09945 [Aspergillus awamori]|uniref:Uncharacterized protein n=1 Tax=Aspergillus awamori TaxID=105351 RepID=A0A401L6E9_ASPAW|nr:hypothetical protein AAWM_09945 [Aspergillus awamori]